MIRFRIQTEEDGNYLEMLNWNVAVCINGRIEFIRRISLDQTLALFEKALEYNGQKTNGRFCTVKWNLIVSVNHGNYGPKDIYSRVEPSFVLRKQREYEMGYSATNVDNLPVTWKVYKKLYLCFSEDAITFMISKTDDLWPEFTFGFNPHMDKLHRVSDKSFSYTRLVDNVRRIITTMWVKDHLVTNTKS